MHAILQHAFGAPDVLRYEQTDDPRPGPGQVRIDVRAAGVHLLDTAFRKGDRERLPYDLPELPMIPGREVAGTVDGVGEGVDPAWIGRRVVAHLGFASGGYAEKAVRETDAVHDIPDEVPFEHAVAMIGTGRTTLMVLDEARLTADDVVLVPAAAGGIGTLLVQAAKHTRAHVVGLAGGPDKTARVRDNGADAAVDYLADDWRERVERAIGDRGATVLFDSVGGGVGRGLFELLAPGGRMIVFGWSSGTPTPVDMGDIVGRAVTVSSALGPHRVAESGGLNALEKRALAEVAAGRLTPAVHTFPLADAAEAHRALEHRATTGKVVLVP